MNAHQQVTDAHAVLTRANIRSDARREATAPPEPISLTDRIEDLIAQCAALRVTAEKLRAESADLRAENADLHHELEQLRSTR